VLVDLVVAEEFNFDCKPEIKVCEKRFVNLEYYTPPSDEESSAATWT
jgi:hypothetical protein